MFRFGKIIESNNKSSRSDRFAEMSKQQQLIESKKQEIKAKFEERKRQEAVDTVQNSDNRSNEHKSAKDHKSMISSRMQSWKKLVFVSSIPVFRFSVMCFLIIYLVFTEMNDGEGNLRRLITRILRAIYFQMTVHSLKSTNRCQTNVSKSFMSCPTGSNISSRQ